MQVDAAPLAAKAAHADALATMMSRPNVFSGDAAGRKTSGVDDVDTFAEGGKATTRERATDALTEVALVHGSVVSVSVEDFVGAVHEPGEYADDTFVAHWQVVQPTICAASEEQQQPPRHLPVPQSLGEAQASPGLTVAHAPMANVHAEHPKRTDEEEQQKLPRQADDAHDELDEQNEPAGRRLPPLVPPPAAPPVPPPAPLVAPLELPFAGGAESETRRRPVPESATKMSPLESSASPCGPEKYAVVPTPSALDCVLLP